MSDLAARLRELTGYATSGGAPDAWLRETAQMLVDILLEREELRRAFGESRLRALEGARSTRKLAERLQAVGYTGAALRKAVCAQEGISSRTFFRRLQCQRGGTGVGNGRLTFNEALKRWRRSS